MSNCNSGPTLQMARKYKMERGLLSLVRVMLVASTLCTGASMSMAGDGWFQSERMELISSLNDLLVSNQLCSDKNDCVKKQIVFVAGEPWGLDVTIYGINNTAVLSQLVSACSINFLRSADSKRKIKVKMKMTATSKQEDMARPFWEKKGNSIEVTFEGAL